MTVRQYTIKEVALRTGLSTQLIRKWEERYEAVTPTRFPNGYRSYSRDDIDKLVWLKSRVDAGVPIGNAVHDYKALETVNEALVQPRLESIADGSELSQYRASLTDCFLKLDQSGAQRLFDRLLALHSMEFVLMEIMQPVLVQIGELWERGELSEFQEHFASHFMRDRLLAVRNLFQSPGVDRPLIVTGCMPGERHEMGILFFGFFALQLGFRVAHLGTSPSEKGILDCLEQFAPVAFAFSVSSADVLERATPFLLRLDLAIQARTQSTLVFIGGRCIAEDRLLPDSSHIYLMAGNAREATVKVRKLTMH